MERKPLPEEIIQILDIKKGMKILDFGCGEGLYSIPIARRVGEEGKVYALDKEKGELEKLKGKMRRLKLHNIELIHSDEKFNLQKESIDIILLFDVLHYINNKTQLFKMCYKVLKEEGLLSVFPHTHFSCNEVIKIVTETGLFTLKDEYEGISLCNFQKR